MYYIVSIHAITNIFTTECSFISIRYTYFVGHLWLKLINMKEVAIGTCLFAEQLEMEDIFLFIAQVTWRKNFFCLFIGQLKLVKISCLKAIITTLKHFYSMARTGRCTCNRKKIQKLGCTLCISIILEILKETITHECLLIRSCI